MTLDAEKEAEIMEGVLYAARAPKLMQILDAVSVSYKVGKRDIMSLCRVPHIVEARDGYYWLAKKLTVRTYPEIGRFLNDRDHTTVWNGVRRVDARMDRHKPRLREVCAKLGVSFEEIGQ
jgi:chromosomal replication initiator protein